MSATHTDAAGVAADPLIRVERVAGRALPIRGNDIDTDDVEVEGDDEDDNTFLETDEEEEGGDVSDIIGDGIEKDDES